MQITRACDYACRALTYLARNGRKPVETSRVARAVDAPPVYLRKIFQSLSKAGFVRTTPGARGGVHLLTSPSDISLRQIVEAVEGPIALSECIAHPESCRNSPTCKVRQNLSAIQDQLHREFSARTVADFT